MNQRTEYKLKALDAANKIKKNNNVFMRVRLILTGICVAVFLYLNQSGFGVEFVGAIVIFYFIILGLLFWDQKKHNNYLLEMRQIFLRKADGGEEFQNLS